MNTIDQPQRTSVTLMDVLPLIDDIVRSMSRHVGAHVSADDLASAAKAALIDCLPDGVTPSPEFTSYCKKRIRGAVLDELRRYDPLSRTGRSQVRMLTSAVSALEAQLGRTPNTEEIADHLGVTADFISKIEQLKAASDLVHWNTNEGELGPETVVADPSPSPAEQIEREEYLVAVRDALDGLSGPQAYVLRRYYFDGATLDVIATEIGKTKPRVHQIRTAAEALLREDPTLLAASRVLFAALG